MFQNCPRLEYYTYPFNFFNRFTPPQILHDGPHHRLHFKEVDLGDKGNYMVKATNSGGDARCFGCLIVKENFEVIPFHLVLLLK